LKTLTLHLKAEYFDQVARGVKVFEYRSATPYWNKRLDPERVTYDEIHLLNGYPSQDNVEARLIFPWHGAYMDTITHPHFGATPCDLWVIPLKA
jgi:hypothetical protein